MGARLQPIVRALGLLGQALFWTILVILALALCALTGLACFVGCVLK